MSSGNLIRAMIEANLNSHLETHRLSGLIPVVSVDVLGCGGNFVHVLSILV